MGSSNWRRSLSTTSMATLDKLLTRQELKERQSDLQNTQEREGKDPLDEKNRCQQIDVRQGELKESSVFISLHPKHFNKYFTLRCNHISLYFVNNIYGF